MAAVANTFKVTMSYSGTDRLPNGLSIVGLEINIPDMGEITARIDQRGNPEEKKLQFEIIPPPIPGVSFPLGAPREFAHQLKITPEQVKTMKVFARLFQVGQSSAIPAGKMEIAFAVPHFDSGKTYCLQIKDGRSMGFVEIAEQPPVSQPKPLALNSYMLTDPDNIKALLAKSRAEMKKQYGH